MERQLVRICLKNMWNIETFAELPSTQTLARERFSSGAARHGDVFVALHQTGGKGRYEDRIWHDEADQNLLMSIVLTEIPSHLTGKMQFVTALSVLATIRALLGQEMRDFVAERVQLKWVNDILVDRKKVSGILCEGIWSGNILKGIVIGVGMNINQEYFSEKIAPRAIALKHILRFSIPLERARDLLLATLQYTLAHYSSSLLLMNDLRSELEWMCELKNFSLTEPDGTKAEGLRYDGITDDGALIVFSQDGNKRIYKNATLNLT